MEATIGQETITACFPDETAGRPRPRPDRHAEHRRPAGQARPGHPCAPRTGARRPVPAWNLQTSCASPVAGRKLEATLALFTELLGFRIAWRVPAADLGEFAAVLGLADTRAELVYLKCRAAGPAR